MSQFYLQDSRSDTGDGLMFWALGGGYTTNLDRAEIFTKEQACGHRETDIPWPKDYVDDRAHLGIDHQYISLDEAHYQLAPGCTVVLQILGHWNGNDIAFAHWPIGHTYRFDKAHRLTLEAAQAIGNAPDEVVIWPVAYLEAKSRRLVHKRDVNSKDALTGSGIVLTKAERRAPASIQNCGGCGRFVRSPSYEGCRHCDHENRP